MLRHRMPRWSLRRLLIALAVPCALVASGCGQNDVKLADNDPLYASAEVFTQRCGGCHTLDVAGTEGSAIKANSKERKDGPNFDTRKEDYQSVLYAIRNGGFSSGPMPQNIVVGEQAQMMACFITKYAGTKRKITASPGKQPATGFQAPGVAEGSSTDPAETGANCPK
jgi:mono/diheme cytochrome c family protein